ncbi:NUDIX domain-containing protein [Paenibacillus sp. FSL K6-4396]|uniref:NUDIX hydrolase n=1 Tax=unclassified Paenibacillus TaxID=185978 RepID=UPI001781699D|nr:NUDIX domain-containing protein [Paenibacillus sp. CFBP 13594]MBD8840105.1 NUDIX domain-containing protein [Paenibacillus sp. CFBP 13594]
MSSLNAEQFPALSTSIHWGIIEAEFRLNDILDEKLVSNISIIPFVGDQCVVFQLDNGDWELPGGTLEAGEQYMDGLKRELMEELGAEMRSYQIFGQFHCTSSALEPYRPHIPHPHFVRIIGYGDVELVGDPLNPEDGEQVVAVEVVETDEAIRRFRAQNRYDIAEMYQLAHMLREEAKQAGKDQLF